MHNANNWDPKEGKFIIGSYVSTSPVLMDDGTVGFTKYKRYVSVAMPWNMASHGLTHEEAISRITLRIEDRAKREDINVPLKFILAGDVEARSMGEEMIDKWLSMENG